MKTDTPDYGVVADHDNLPELTISEEQLENERLALFGADDEFKPIPVSALFDSAWSRMFDRFYQERLVYVRSNNVILLRFLYTYEVDLDRIRTERNPLGWVHHLCNKPWMNGERTKKFIEAVAEIKKFKLYGSL
jgi:hypothetical protein